MDGELNINLGGAGADGIGGVEAVPSEEAIKTTTSSLDTISAAEAVAMVLSLYPSTPVLVPPIDNNTKIDPTQSTITSISLKVSSTEGAIVDKSWEVFEDGIKALQKAHKEKEAKHAKEQIDRPDKGTVLYDQRLDQTLSTFKQWLVDPAQATSASQQAIDGVSASAFMAPFLAGTLIANIDIVRDVVGVVGLPQDRAVSGSPIAEALAATSSQGLHLDAQSALLTINLLVGGVKLQSTAEAVAESIEEKGKPSDGADEKFVDNFVARVLKITTPTIAGDDVPATLNQNNLVRLNLQVIAFNLLYRTHHGGMTGEELAGFIKGGSAKEPDQGTRDWEVWKMMNDLIGAIRKSLPSANPDVMLALMDYVDEKHSAQSMLSTYKMLSNQLAQNYAVNLQNKSQEKG
jgi:hypothetical protein